jgi:hypothetical protein
VVLASMTDVGQLKGFGVPRGLRSLLRRTRSFWGCRRSVSWSLGVLIVVLLAPASSWAQPPPPDPPPPGVHGSPSTRLEPDRPPGRERAARRAPAAPIEETAPVEVEETVVAPPVDVTAPAPQTSVAQTTPRPQKRVTRRPASQPGRRFVLADKPARRAPRAVETIHTFSSDPDSRPYLLAALSLAVLALGSGTLLTVLSRLRSTRQGLA